MKFRIVADGKTGLTHVYNGETGEEIGCTKVSFVQESPDDIPKLVLEMQLVDVEIEVVDYVPENPLTLKQQMEAYREGL